MREEKQDQPYTTKIIKASALVPDTLTLLASWDLGQPIEENLARARRENVFGKASRSRVEDILLIFRQRYLTDESVLRALVALKHSALSPEVLERILYFHAAQADALLHDAATQRIWSLYEQGYRELRVEDLQRAVKKWVAEGKTTTEWGDYTIRRVARGLAATLRDFGVLEGKVRKRIAPPYLPVEAFAYLAYVLCQEVTSGHEALAHESWRLYLLSRSDVERLFLEAHQRHLLNYQAAGSVVRVDFPAHTLEAYAHAIASATG